MHIRSRNVNKIFPIGIMYINREGELRDSRNGTTLEIMEPAVITYDCPDERVLFEPKRDANPFFHLFEALWMLAGRADVAFLDQYNKGMSQYSDDGIVFNAPYGYRLRHTFGYDQLDLVIKKIRKDPNDRRVVLQIHDPSDENLRGDSKDHACLGGMTNIPGPEGDISISELAYLFKNNYIDKWAVYAVNMETGEQSIEWCDKVWSNGVKKVKRLIFDNGTSLIVTDNHILYRKRKIFSGQRCVEVHREPVEVSKLRIGDRLEATGINWEGSGGKLWIKKNLFMNTQYANRQYIHRAYYELVYGKLADNHDVHHHNEDSKDNTITNLEAMAHGDHSAIHRHIDNPMKKMTKAQHESRVINWRKTVEEKHGWKNHTDIVNHKIVAIEDAGEQEVFDFHVPSTHIALIADGIVAHNCNLVITPRARHGRLDWTVFNRSNDYVFGMTGANVVHMSVIHEYVARMCNLKLGSYTQISNCLHAYTENNVWQRVKDLPVVASDPYSMGTVKPYPLITFPSLWDKELREWMECPWSGRKYADPFFENVAKPMAVAHHAHKENKDGLRYAGRIAASDWRLATTQWLERRECN